LSVRIVRVRPRHFVTVAVRCQPACTLRLDLIGKPRKAIRGARRVATRGVTVKAHRARRVRLRIRHAGDLQRRARVRASAAARGAVTVRSRSVRMW
jgi:hypothetical protein